MMDAETLQQADQLLRAGYRASQKFGNNTLFKSNHILHGTVFTINSLPGQAIQAFV